MALRMAERGRLIVVTAFSIAILFSALGLPVAADGSQNSGQNNPGGYVKYTLILLNNTLINGNFVNTGSPWHSFPVGIAYDPSNGYLYVTDMGWSTVLVIDGTSNTVIATIHVGIAPTGITYDPSNGYIYVVNYLSGTVSIIATSVSTKTTLSTVPAWAVAAVAVAAVVIAALLVIKYRKP